MPNHVIVSTLGWSKQPLETAFRGIAELEFSQADLAVFEGWAHLNPSELADGGEAHVRQEADRIRTLATSCGLRRVSAMGAGLRTNVIAEQRRRWAAVCDLAAALEVPVVRLDASPRGEPVENEVVRLTLLNQIAQERGITLAVETHANQLTEQPSVAVRLCKEVKGLALTLDASHFWAGPNQGDDYSMVFPYVRHVHLRDAGLDWDHIQMPAGTGKVNFGADVQALHALGYAGKFAIEYIDSIPVSAPSGEPTDIPSNILRMRDTFIAAERAAGVVRTPA